MHDKIRLLIVEDDRVAAEMYKLRFELDGYAVSVATNGQTAVQLVQANPPDLIFLDIRLPGMDGFDVLQLLQADHRTRSVPIVILSGYGQEEYIDRALNLGAVEYLVKGRITPSQIASSVPTWVH